jgi:hypothetical protein
MSIKIIHTHEDKTVCYTTSTGRWGFTDIGLFKIFNEEFAAGYMPYTGFWYAYNPETGKEIAKFDKDFFEKDIIPYKIGDLIYDPDCV